MEVHALASTKEKALSARVEKGSKERTAKVKTKNNNNNYNNIRLFAIEVRVLP